MRSKNVMPKHKNNPFFSVIVPLYNKELYIKRTLASILNQSFLDFEVLVIDDGSTDNSASIVIGENDARIKYKKKLNGGESSSRNYGIRVAVGTYVTFLDADDEWDSDHLATIKNFIDKNGEPDVVCTNYRIISEVGVSVAHSSCSNTPTRLNYFRDSIDVLPLMTSNTSILSRRIIDKVGYFNEDLVIGPDLDYWMRVVAHSEPWFLPKPSATYHQEADGRQCKKYRGFNKRFIESMIYNIKNIKNQSDAKKYVEVLFWREIRQMFYFGQNRQARFQIHKYSDSLQLGWRRWSYLIGTYMPIHLLYARYRAKNVFLDENRDN
jgi:glycosyltransferase involved in cell wall biosynthesis